MPHGSPCGAFRHPRLVCPNWRHILHLFSARSTMSISFLIRVETGCPFFLRRMERLIGVEKRMKKAKKNIGSKDGLEKACESGDFTKGAIMRSGETEL
ncbi:hypothetical protein PIB30_039034 [Stylosanthes scabra]|uniref:Uncharacterized protein n=1 Tax=Stylosanthes scabra TaxID=79078 RepID=A0ABU6REA8_9FABA|nr:hypothetical protein [Stylosanthes scabra]